MESKACDRAVMDPAEEYEDSWLDVVTDRSDERDLDRPLRGDRIDAPLNTEGALQ